MVPNYLKRWTETIKLLYYYYIVNIDSVKRIKGINNTKAIIDPWFL